MDTPRLELKDLDKDAILRVCLAHGKYDQDTFDRAKLDAAFAQLLPQVEIVSHLGLDVVSATALFIATTVRVERIMCCEFMATMLDMLPEPGPFTPATRKLITAAIEDVHAALVTEGSGIMPVPDALLPLVSGMITHSSMPNAKLALEKLVVSMCNKTGAREIIAGYTPRTAEEIADGMGLHKMGQPPAEEPPDNPLDDFLGGRP